MILENTNNKIRGVRFNINKTVTLILEDGDEKIISSESKSVFIKEMLEFNPLLSITFLENLYKLSNGW